MERQRAPARVDTKSEAQWAGRDRRIPKDLRIWLFEEESFVPLALFQDGKAYSIVTDHLGTPVEAYNEQGEEVWYRRLDINGKVIEERSMNYTSYKDYVKIPFLFQGQYYDEEIKLAYNRFRYYDPQMGRYISEDPIGLESGKIGLYHYVDNSLVFLDIFGLDVRDGIGRTHVKYSGLKNGKPYHSYASASSDLNLTAEDIIMIFLHLMRIPYQMSIM